MSSALLDLAGVSLACRDQDTLLKTFAARAGAAIDARAVFIWLGASDGQGLSYRVRWTDTEERFNPAGDTVIDGFLSEISKTGKMLRLNVNDFFPDALSHLDQASRRREVGSCRFSRAPMRRKQPSRKPWRWWRGNMATLAGPG